MSRITIADSKELFDLAINNLNSGIRYRLSVDARTEKGDKKEHYYLWPVGHHYGYSQVIYDLSPALGKEIYEAWPNKRKNIYSTGIEAYGSRTLVGIVGILKNKDYDKQIKQAKNNFADQQKENEIAFAKAQIHFALKNLRSAIDKYGPVIAVTQDMLRTSTICIKIGDEDTCVEDTNGH